MPLKSARNAGSGSESIAKIGCRRDKLDGKVLELSNLLSDGVIRDVDVPSLFVVRRIDPVPTSQPLDCTY